MIALLLIPYGAVTAVQGVAYSTGNTGAIEWMGLFSPISLIDGLQTAFLGATSAFPGGEGPTAGVGIAYLLVVLGLIAGSYAALMARYRKAGL